MNSNYNAGYKNRKQYYRDREARIPPLGRPPVDSVGSPSRYHSDPSYPRREYFNPRDRPPHVEYSSGTSFLMEIMIFSFKLRV